MNRQGRFFQLGLAISTANLILLPVWSELLFTDEKSHYYMLYPPVALDYLAAIADLLLLSILFFVAQRLITLANKRLLSGIVKVLFLSLLLIPLNTIRLITPGKVSISVLLARISQGNLIWLILLVVAFLSYLGFRFRRRIFEFAAIFVFGFLPFTLMTTVQALAKAINPPNSFSSRMGTPKSAARSKVDDTRIVWILFDELDESMTFSRRPSGIELPAFDLLRKESIHVTKARAPMGGTALSIPSLLTGVLLMETRAAGFNDLSVKQEGANLPVPLSSLPNVFRSARKAGFRTTVVGWYHPYCRLFDADLDRCLWRPVYQTFSGQRTLEEKNFLKAMWDQLVAISPLNGRRLAIDAYLRILEESKQAVTQSSGLIFLHFPIPHAPVIYNRDRNSLTMTRISHIQGYVDNLVLVDRTLAELREAMEKSRTWQKSAIIVSSDHPWRDSQFYDGRREPYVPFLVKMAGDSTPITIDDEFHTIHTQEFVLTVLEKLIPDNSSAAQWIQSRRQPLAMN